MPLSTLARYALLSTLLVPLFRGSSPDPEPVPKPPEVAPRPVYRTFYVDPVYGLDTNDGLSLTSPVRTILKAGLLAGPGDTVQLRGSGVYPHASSFSSVDFSGTPGNPITVESFPGETAVFDPGHPAFMTAPNAAWVPCSEPGAHPEEWVSAANFDADTRWGMFLETRKRLLAYSRVEDLRATNESDAIVPLSDPRPAGGPLASNPARKWVWAYRGPGMWWNPATRRVHIRLSYTHWNQPGVLDYAGPTDPRNVRLSVCTFSSFASEVRASHIVFRNIVFQNGGSNATVSIVGAQHATFDHCSFRTTRNGVRITTTKFLSFRHCLFTADLPSYVCREDVKSNYDFIGPQGIESNGLCRTTNAILLATSVLDEDLEVANCEFRDTHDVMQVWGYRPRIHHNLIENVNDEVFQLDGAAAVEDVRIHDNVVRKALSVFCHALGTISGTGQRFYYRNVIDRRLPTLGQRHMDPGDVHIWRTGSEFKMNLPVSEFYCYQNTFVEGDNEDRTCSAALGNASMADPHPRAFMNNLFLSIGADEPLYDLPDPAFPALSDGNAWCRRLTVPARPLYGSFNGVNYADFAAMHATGLWPAWEVNSIFVYPRFANVPDIDHAFCPLVLPNADYRLLGGSPAIGHGAALPPSWPDSLPYDATPDIGALPFGAGAVAVGIDAAQVFPKAGEPIAEAGDFSVVADADGDGFQTVMLDGTASSDPGGTIGGWSWTLDGAVIGTTATLAKALPVGTHRVFLTVTDNTFRQATDMREITITTADRRDNLVQNPGFESGSTAWSLSFGASAVTSPTHFGTGAMLLGGGWVPRTATQTIAVVPGASVTCSTWLKTQGLTFGKRAFLELSWLDAALVPLSGLPLVIGQQTGNVDWSYYAATHTAPANAAYAQIQLVLDPGATGGIALFDDLRLLIANRALNGHFERGLADWIPRNAPRATSAPANVRSGGLAAEMMPSPDYTMISQRIAVAPSTAYTISAYLKTAAMTKNLTVKLYWRSATTAVVGQATIGSATGTQPWTLVSGTVTAPASAVSLELQIRTDGTETGTCWIEDVVVR